MCVGFVVFFSAVIFPPPPYVFTHRHSSELLIQGSLGCGNFPWIFLTIISVLLICSRYYMISILLLAVLFSEKYRSSLKITLSKWHQSSSYITVNFISSLPARKKQCSLRRHCSWHEQLAVVKETEESPIFFCFGNIHNFSSVFFLSITATH